ncbi:TIGR04255 family protein [Pseudomonas lini]|uniref:TIGR04255 family protein n=1 Tax=Pseudomonas lini TaxID=163011 RepID=UPI0009E53D56|nr:TIGR04255 family protein [Pseudomonas lini]
MQRRLKRSIVAVTAVSYESGRRTVGLGCQPNRPARTIVVLNFRDYVWLLMKISPTPRVIYKKNPLAEVVCQIRFERVTDSSVFAIQFYDALISLGYVNKSEEVSYNVVIDTSEQQVPEPRTVAGDAIVHFTKEDETWRVSVSPEFLAFTCNSYRDWSCFLPEIIKVVDVFKSSTKTPLVVTRLGLRYKDVIERETLGLADTPWHELINPFLLGALALGSLSDDEGFDEGGVESQLSQTLLKLDDCKLLLQSSLLTSVVDSNKAFLIDADFFHELIGDDLLYQSGEKLEGLLETLHSNAGALFRRGITEKLHGALGPT